jgi:hypothetical protein
MISWWTYQQLRSGNPKTRQAAVARLADSGHPDSVEPLVFALKDTVAEIRGAAATALARFQDARSLEPLIQRAGDPVAIVRSAAAEALGHFQGERSLETLTGLLGDADGSVRLCAARSLDRLGWHPTDAALHRAHALATGNLGGVADLDADHIGPLLEWLERGPLEKQLAALQALRQISDPRLSGWMQAALQKESVPLRLAALETLEQLADPSAYEAVERLLKDKASKLRAAAAMAAARCDRKRAGPILAGMLKDVSWEVRLAAVKALGTTGDAGALDSLCRALQDMDHDVREGAAQALGRMGEARAIQPLVLALLDVQSFVRTAAHHALVRIDTSWEKTAAARSALPQIQAARTHREHWISESAGKLLEQIQPATEGPAPGTTIPGGRAVSAAPSALTLLLELLEDSNRDLRLAAAQALGELRDPNGAPGLRAAAEDKDPSVRHAAGHALAALG